VVESFVFVARKQLLGPPYLIYGKKSQNRPPREVPRQAFRIEVVDDFRIDGLAREIYRDLIRYGLFIRDNRGKSIRGSFVPRLFLRKLLIPYAVLALSRKDSVQLKCEEFNDLLLRPDKFKNNFRVSSYESLNLITLFDKDILQPDAQYDIYDDLEDENKNGLSDSKED